MKHILFSHPYFLALDPKQAEAGLPYPPLGTLYAAALMRENGYKISLFDAMFARSATEILPLLQAKRQDYFVVYADGFNYLTKMCLSNMQEATFEMIRIAKQWGCTVIVSSSDSTDHTETYLEKGADFIINGEAEWTLLELIDALERAETRERVDALEQGAGEWGHIKGIAYRKAIAVAGTDGSKPGLAIHKTAPRPVMKDWESLPFPAFDLVDIERYRDCWMKHAGYFSLNVATTRGCPFHCNWCAKPIYGNRYTARSAEHVVRQLKELKELCNFDHIWFCDDIFGLKPGWVKEFADAVEREGLSFSFKIQSRADLLVKEDTVRDLARAGCKSVWMGAESGSQKILDAMDKGTTVEQIETATHLLKESGIKPCFFIQFGYLGETKEDIDLTVRLIQRLLPHEIGISVSYPLPGTGFYEKVKTTLGAKSNWTDSDELALMFRNTYSPAYYKQLYRYVHRTHRQHIALDYLSRLWRRPGKLTAGMLRKISSVGYYLPAAYLAKIKLHQLEQSV
jgi:anaerobic magnesium-protoporphyrin IX monomethyl ester cyclase